MSRNYETFTEWMARVDAAVEARVGMSYLDLPDVAYFDMYEDGKSPKAAAARAIREAGGEMMSQ